jgi:hypothetical protein
MESADFYYNGPYIGLYGVLSDKPSSACRVIGKCGWDIESACVKADSACVKADSACVILRKPCAPKREGMRVRVGPSSRGMHKHAAQEYLPAVIQQARAT